MAEHTRAPARRTVKRAVRLIACLASGAAIWMIAGCAENSATTRPLTMEQKQQKALEDPYGYSAFDKPADEPQKPDISDRGAGLGRDVDHVFNP